MQRIGLNIALLARTGWNRLSSLKLGIAVTIVLAVAGLCVVQSQQIVPHASSINPAMPRFVPISEESYFNTDSYKSAPQRKYHDVYLPAVLSEQDIVVYQIILDQQKRGNWAAADAAINRLENQLLLGHVLADRYLHKRYRTEYDEVKQWLKNYPDLPQAARLYNLALNRKPLKENIGVRVEAKPVLKGYGDGHGRSSNADSIIHKPGWQAGITAFRNGDKATAANHFAALVRNADTLSAWDSSRAAYWAFRSYSVLGNKKKASYFLHLAAAEPRSFYGIIARKRLGMGLDVTRKPEAIEVSDIVQLYGNLSVRRAIALREIGRTDLAEMELRQVFPAATEEGKEKLLQLSILLDLPALQMRIGRSLSDEDTSLDYAIYPTPRWQPRGGFEVDPALVFAFARQESGFHAKAESQAGAYGVMQLMPQTAKYIASQLPAPVISSDLSVKTLAEPEENIALGQRYLAYLLRQKQVDGNLFYLAAAYNAGPGKLAEWQESLRYGNDPLLFVETIPYSETSNHIQQVMTSYWIYSEIMKNTSPSLAAIAQHQWPQYRYTPSTELASATF